jgi:hypothetical protein
MHLGEVRFNDDGRWMELAQDHVQWHAFCICGRVLLLEDCLPDPY